GLVGCCAQYHYRSGCEYNHKQISSSALSSAYVAIKLIKQSLSFHERFILASSAPLAYCVSLFPHLNACNYVITVKVMWAEQSSLDCNSPFPQ
ncbi:unnamed protein product, partial [Musa hybrid cultivar]